MDLWKGMVKSNKIPTNKDAKLRYNADHLVCSAIVPEYHVMIQKGLEFSYVTNGIARILLRVPQTDSGTCDPNSEVDMEMEANFANTSVASTLFVSDGIPLACARSGVREFVGPDIPIWKTSFDHTRSYIPEDEFRQLFLNSDSNVIG
ncbi:hypothetical protein N7451_012479 [Penicillium sp. IBT 35674x]|nr:hypothetical protein N7451_012479 [Penicillium sp. IBT 35674x]